MEAFKITDDFLYIFDRILHF